MPARTIVDVIGSPRGRRTVVAPVVVAVVVAAALVWWWYPTLSGDSAKTDVAIVGDSFLSSAHKEVTDRIHEDGFSLDWAPQIDSWCDAAAAVRTIVDRDHPSWVVVSFADDGPCATDRVAVRQAVADAAGSAKLIVVANPDADPASPLPARAAVVEPAQLLGPPGTIDRQCLWFDPVCPPDGAIAVRDEAGALTQSGQTRVARLIVAALR